MKLIYMQEFHKGTYWFCQTSCDIRVHYDLHMLDYFKKTRLNFTLFLIHRNENLRE
jgi:hypothetical protein